MSSRVLASQGSPRGLPVLGLYWNPNEHVPTPVIECLSKSTDELVSENEGKKKKLPFYMPFYVGYHQKMCPDRVGLPTLNYPLKKIPHRCACLLGSQ